MPLYLSLLHVAFQTELTQVMPIVLVMLAVGLATGILQAALQIEDTTFSLLPKIGAMVALGLTGGFGALTGFDHLAIRFILQAPDLVRRTWS
jgi:flagellar biosynthesis protein FliQ